MAKCGRVNVVWVECRHCVTAAIPHHPFTCPPSGRHSGVPESAGPATRMPDVRQRTLSRTPRCRQRPGLVATVLTGELQLRNTTGQPYLRTFRVPRAVWLHPVLP